MQNLIIETMALFTKHETKNDDPVDELMDEINGPIDGDKYDTPFVFDMYDVIAVHKSGILGYSTIWTKFVCQIIKIPYTEAVELFKKSRESAK